MINSNHDHSRHVLNRLREEFSIVMKSVSNFLHTLSDSVSALDAKRRSKNADTQAAFVQTHDWIRAVGA